MTKKNKVLFAGISFAFVSAMAITGYSVSGLANRTSADECSHELMYHAAVASTDTAEGNLPYYICCKCHQSYFDSAAAKKIGYGKPSIPTVSSSTTDTALQTLNASKVKFMDQSQYFTDYDNTSSLEYVTVAGKTALHFSNSKTGYTVTQGSAAADCVGKAAYADGQAPSEFRFALDTNKAATSFEYDYLYWDVTPENVGSDAGITDCHAFFQLNTNASVDFSTINTSITGSGTYVPFEANLTNDAGSWDVTNLSWHHVKVDFATPVVAKNFITKITGFTGEFYVANPTATYAPAEFAEATGTDVNTGTSIKDYYGYDAATSADTLPQVTLSDIGAATGALPTDGSHVWGKYDVAGNGGMDLTLDYSYTAEGGNFNTYLFNGQNEDGIIIRVDNSGSGYVQGYIYATATQTVAYDDGVNSGTAMASAGTTTYFNQDVAGAGANVDMTMHIKAVITDAATNAMNIKISFGVKGGTESVVRYPFMTGCTTNVMNLNVTFGADYFASSAHQWYRVSNVNSTTSIANHDFSAGDHEIVYKGESGVVYGKKTVASGEAVGEFPTVTKDGYKFSGWYDQTGNLLTASSVITAKTVATARFCKVNSENTYTLSDSTCGAAGAQGTYTAITGENGYNLPITSTATRIDTYIVTKLTFAAGDNYTIFGFPYDFTDGHTRVYLRFNLNTGSAFSTYFYGGSQTDIGGASESTRHNFSNIPEVDNGNYMVHMYSVATATENVYTMGFDVTYLGNGATGSYSQSVTMGSSYAINSVARNMLACVNTCGSGTASWTSAW